ncbi:MAG: TonB family protein [Cyclobacteriaceae bacterium]|nr:TonB family protein [Cyclobacteriaceae bacterium]
MKFPFALLFALVLTSAYGQELRVFRNATPYKYEEYTILKKSKTRIREGQYLRLAPGRGDTIAIGQYKDNLRSGRWRYYENKLPIAAGRYSEDNKIGEWTYYANGKPSLRYNHTDNAVVWQAPVTTDSDIPEGEDVTPTRLERNAVCPGLHQLIVENISYPPQALRNGVSGAVMLSILVKTDGTATDFKIEKGVGGGCDNELLRVVKLNTSKWIPGLLNGKPVSTRQYVTAEFTLTAGDMGIKTAVY